MFLHTQAASALDMFVSSSVVQPFFQQTSSRTLPCLVWFQGHSIADASAQTDAGAGCLWPGSLSNAAIMNLTAGPLWRVKCLPCSEQWPYLMVFPWPRFQPEPLGAAPQNNPADEAAIQSAKRSAGSVFSLFVISYSDSAVSYHVHTFRLELMAAGG